MIQVFKFFSCHFFDLDLALYDSVFYVKISYDNGKIEISKPYVEVFSDIPEKLNKNIK